MSKNYIYLQDKAFLKKIDRLRLKEQHIRVVVLDFMTETAIQSIEGSIQGGTENLTGNSAIRRTCNLSMVTPEQENTLHTVRNLLSINKKIEIEIGITNTTDEYTDYDVIWFPQGVYVITGVSISSATSGINISLQCKDKMCLLNGECGGVLPASTQFDMYETIDETGNYVLHKPTIYQIIYEAVNHFGGEDPSRIIISDIPDRVRQVMRWTGTTPLYLYNSSSKPGEYTATVNFNDIQGKMVPASDDAITLEPGQYREYVYGDNVGYTYTDFVYPNDLIGDVGSNVCDILEAIKNLLGNFEYFYDVNGNFIFQEIKNYLNNAQSTTYLNNARRYANKVTDLNEKNYLINFTEGKSVYQFDDGALVSAYSNTPQYNMIKNDFIVWGKKTTVDGLELPIRYHLTLDEKPQLTKTETVELWLYTDPETNITTWRYPIDYIGKPLPKVGSVDYYYQVAAGINGVRYWDPERLGYFQVDKNLYHPVTIGPDTDWRVVTFIGDLRTDGNSASSRFQAEMKHEFPKVYDMKNNCYKNDYDGASLDYWLDMIDSNGAIAELNVSNIGLRSKAVTDDSINCLFEPSIPDVIYIKTGEANTAELSAEAAKNGIPYSQVGENLFQGMIYGGGYNAAYDLVRSLLYQYTSYNESITLQTLPIYYLEPNTRISVNDSTSAIYGDYVINSITLPLDINSTMSISCTRALEQL